MHHPARSFVLALVVAAGCASPVPSMVSDLAVPDLASAADLGLADFSVLDGATPDGSPVDSGVDAATVDLLPEPECRIDQDCPQSRSCCGGVCVDERSDPTHCSSCANHCPGASPSCCNSACTNVTTDVANCGQCGLSCSTLNGTPSCGGGQCSWVCTGATAHCMAGSNSGCETPTDTLTNCGGCGNACNASDAANVRCDGTSCHYTCNPGYADCVTTAPNLGGCSTNLSAVGEKLCGGLCAPQSSCCSTADCTALPTPSACYSASCANAGGSCSYPKNVGSVVCSSTCCNAINGSCNGDCTLSCAHGYCDTDGSRANGCEAQSNTTSSCSACGTVCDPKKTATGATCNGTTCLYGGCTANHQNCNGATAPDSDGCECLGTACCAGGACQFGHADGVGDAFYDCVALNTHNSAQAIEAAKAATGIPGTVSAPGEWSCSTQSSSGKGNAICKQGSNNCTCWYYSSTGNDTEVGHVSVNSANNTCLCSDPSTDPTWS